MGRASIGLASGEDPAHIVTDGRAAVLRAGWPPGTGTRRFGCTGWGAGLRTEVSEPPPHAGGRESVRFCRLLPGSPQVCGERTGEPKLGMDGDHQPCPPVGRLRTAKPRFRPPKGLLEQAERVLKERAAMPT
jgi:hypothetical protein